MDVQIEETGRFGRKMSVTVPQAEVDKAYDDVTREVAKGARIPGFRQGKIPRELVEKHYAKEIHSEVRDRLVNTSLMKAIAEKDASPVNMPKVQLGELGRGAEFKYTAEFEVQPEVKVQKAKGLKVAKVEAAVDTKEVDEQLEILRKQAAQLVPVLIRDTVEDGDVVLVDYEGTMGGVPFKGGTAENALIEVGSEGYLPQFVEGIKGARVPGERHVQVDFPADYQAPELAGKPASFRIKLKELKKKELPALDDEFAKDVGEESLTALRTKIETALKERKQREADDEQKKKLLEALVDANPFEVPPSMIAEQTDRMISGAAQRVEQMVGRRVTLSPEEVENLRKDSEKNAEFQVRSGLLLLQVAQDNDLKVDNAALDAEIEAMAASAGEHGARVRAFYQDQDQRSRLSYRVLEDKVVKFLLENAEIG